MIERASPVQLRKALEMANLFVKAGMRFVPMPVTSDDEYDEMMRAAIAKIGEMEQAAIAHEPSSKTEG